MKLNRLLPGILGFLLSLPLCLCSKPGGLFFATHSSNPWSHHQRWLLPFHQHTGVAMADIIHREMSLKRAHTACGNSSISPGTLPPLNHSSVLGPPIGLNRLGKPNISAIGNNRFASENLTDFPSDDDLKSGAQGIEDKAPSCEPQVTGMSGYVGLHSIQVLRTVGLVIWLGLLFYLLGTTASDYFSCTLEKLSDVLNLSPAVAGVTLLAIGNGAPDVFSSVVSFASSDRTGSIGFGSVLGGALFITTVVSGMVAIVTSKGGREPRFFLLSKMAEALKNINGNGGSVDVCVQESSNGGSLEERLLGGQNSGLPTEKNVTEGSVRVDLACFIRDVMFLLIAVGVLTLILLDGEVKLWEAIAFFCIYPIYASFVWTAELLQSRRRIRRSSLANLLLVKATIENSLPAQWVDEYSIQEHQHHHYHVHSQELEAEVEHRWDNPRDHSYSAKLKHWLIMFYKYCIEWPLALPRQLTIPVVEEERWSRKLAIASCTLAPVFVAAVWAINFAGSVESALLVLGVGGSVGIVLGVLAYFNTNDEQPPQKMVTLWLAGGFFMSIVWFYLVANELVQTLETLGSLFGINTAILALTVLAWGNSIGDLVADLSLACSGPVGVQIAVSGCYAGPLFNTVFGLGLSLVLGCLKSHPEPFLIADKDGSLFYIIGFLAIGLVWALIILPLQGMRLGRSLGTGLILLYISFLGVGICYTMGWL